MESIWFGTDARSQLIRGSLIPASLAYAGGSILFRKVYDWGLKRAQSPHPRAICVGNLTVGGSGKTPVTVAIGKFLSDQGCRVIIGASGYGSPAAEGANFAPDGPLAPSQWGDEPAVIRANLPELPMVVGRDRVQAAQIAFAKDPNSVLLMDDGFQHLRLRVKVPILIEGETRNVFCIPAGPFREHPSARRYACRSIREPDEIQYVRFAEHPVEVPYYLLTAIARPERFIGSATALAGRPPFASVIRPDHDPLRDGNLLGEIPSGSTILTTEKDWVKISRRPDVDRHDWNVVRQTASLSPEFFEWLLQELES